MLAYDFFRLLRQKNAVRESSNLAEFSYGSLIFYGRAVLCLEVIWSCFLVITESEEPCFCKLSEDEDKFTPSPQTAYWDMLPHPHWLQPTGLLFKYCITTEHILCPNCTKFHTALPWALINKSAECEGDEMNDSGDVLLTYRQRSGIIRWSLGNAASTRRLTDMLSPSNCNCSSSGSWTFFSLQCTYSWLSWTCIIMILLCLTVLFCYWMQIFPSGSIKHLTN